LPPGLLATAFVALFFLPAAAARADEYRATREPLPDALWQRMQGSSWHPSLACPAREDLTLLRLAYHDFDGRDRMGEMIVHASVAGDVTEIFRGIYDSGFQIFSMRLVEEFGGSDDRSMEANNTSAFNCRKVPFGSALSAHSGGIAIDVNPLQNPYIRGDKILPATGKAYAAKAARAAHTTGLIADDSPLIAIFAARGWTWGGFWRNSKDYQHFSRNGR
jgi:poly-gamma-glutamate synthesis protein (capsule biosynthesis protein)